MRCPFCSNEDTQVVDTRSNEGTNVIRRRRKCPKWGSNPHSFRGNRILSPARLPIPPFGLTYGPSKVGRRQEV